MLILIKFEDLSSKPLLLYEDFFIHITLHQMRICRNYIFSYLRLFL